MISLNNHYAQVYGYQRGNQKTGGKPYQGQNGNGKGKYWQKKTTIENTIRYSANYGNDTRFLNYFKINTKPG